MYPTSPRTFGPGDFILVPKRVHHGCKGDFTEPVINNPPTVKEPTRTASPEAEYAASE